LSSVKVSDLFKKSQGWYSFFIEFHDYKLCGDLPDIFGRDEELDLDDLYHIHLAGNLQIQAQWRARRLQFDRKTPTNAPDLDYWLIYAYEPLRDEYLLLTILGPDAHNRRAWGSYLRTIHQEIVTPWVLGRIDYSDPDE
jgi:mRNA interferase YafO